MVIRMLGVMLGIMLDMMLGIMMIKMRLVSSIPLVQQGSVCKEAFLRRSDGHVALKLGGALQVKRGGRILADRLHVRTQGAGRHGDGGRNPE